MPNLLRASILAALLLLPVAACSSGGGDAETATDTLTRRQKDSLISTMPVPGSGAVGKALEVSDSLRSRAERHDTMF